MKQTLATALALICASLVIALIATKRSDDAQHETDAGAIADLSNQLDSAQIQIATCKGAMVLFSNRLDESRSAAVAVSNQLAEAQSAVVLSAEQITNLNQRVAELTSGNQTLQATLDQRVMDLTNQVAGLARQLALTRTNLDQANRDYSLLENRLRRDVAERVVVERKFNDPAELQSQLEELQWSPAKVVTADRIYAGLDVEVKSNAFHVISPQ